MKYRSRFPRGDVAAARRDRRAMSDDARALWTLVRNHRTGAKFRQMFPIGPYVLRFFCVEHRIALELATDASSVEREIWLAHQGIRLIRLPPGEPPFYTSWRNVISNAIQNR